MLGPDGQGTGHPGADQAPDSDFDSPVIGNPDDQWDDGGLDSLASEDDSTGGEGESPSGQDGADKGSTDWQKRHGDALRYAQGQKARADALERDKKALNDRINRLQDSGFNLDEIEKILIGDKSGAPASGNAGGAPTPAAPGQGNFITREEFQGAVGAFAWQNAKTNLKTAYPAFKDPDLDRMLDFEASRIVYEERQNHAGFLTSPPEEVYRKASKNVARFIKKIKGEGVKGANAKRKQVKDAGQIEGGKSQIIRDEEEETGDLRNFTVTSFQSAQDKFRG